MTDLRLQVSIEHVEVYIANRTLGGIGHTARERFRTMGNTKALRARVQLANGRQGRAPLDKTSASVVDEVRTVGKQLQQQQMLQGKHARWNTAKKGFIGELKKKRTKHRHKNRHKHDVRNVLPPPVTLVTGGGNSREPQQ